MTAHDDVAAPSTSQPDLDRFLRLAFGLATEAVAHGDPPYGSLLIAPDGAVLATASNTTISDDDITAHPELKLARWAARRYSPEQAADLTMVSSCQPCTMCANTIARAHIGHVVYGLSNAQLQTLKPTGLAPPDSTAITYDGPHLFDEVAPLVRNYYRL